MAYDDDDNDDKNDQQKSNNYRYNCHEYHYKINTQISVRQAADA